MKRRSLLTLGGIFTIATIGFCCYLLVSLMAHEQTTTEISFTGIERIEFDLGAGGIELTGSSGDSIASGRRIVDRGVQEPTFSEEVVGNTLRLSARCPDFSAFNCGSRYELAVPAGVDVSGTSSGGAITITGVTGAITVHSSAGDIAVRDPIGPLELSSSGGGVSVTGGRSAEVVASSTNAGVSLEFVGSPMRVDAESSSGDVTVTLPKDGAVFAIDASADNGEREVDVSTDPTSQRTIRAYASSGDVTIRYTEPGP
ncbi:MAG: DUF4097 domain-containing protein [Actinomycetia bacterium]|nr:DUF4097 domain-containing protein [Actinomycetes bacterium]